MVSVKSLTDSKAWTTLQLLLYFFCEQCSKRFVDMVNQCDHFVNEQLIAMPCIIERVDLGLTTGV